MTRDNLGDRMKEYENVSRTYLTKRTPTIIRIDGKAFHTFTKGFEKPVDKIFQKTMVDTAKFLCKNIMGCKLAYVQSDEITLLLTDYDKLTTESWFGKNIQKMVSVSASMATLAFNRYFRENIESNKDALSPNNIYLTKIDSAMLDSRVFNLPKEEVTNNFIWRQQDATRNAILSLGYANFPAKNLNNMNCDKIQDKLFTEKNINFNDLPTSQKRGVCIVKETYEKDGANRTRWIADTEIPIFTKNREYIEKYI